MVFLINDISENDLAKYHIWEVFESNEREGIFVCPSVYDSVDSFDNKLISTLIELNNGLLVRALVGNVDVENALLTKHFITFTFFKNGESFVMARYHDYDWDRNGPTALSKFLGVELSEVFPFKYDVSDFYVVENESLKGEMQVEPEKRLARAELIRLLVP